MRALSEPMVLLLRTLYKEGVIEIAEDEPSPFDLDLIREAESLGMVRRLPGSGWVMVDRVILTGRGRRMLGYPSLAQRLLSMLWPTRTI
jgi:hypothetical protein